MLVHVTASKPYLCGLAVKKLFVKKYLHLLEQLFTLIMCKECFCLRLNLYIVWKRRIV